MGIDPGVAACGYGVVERKGSRLEPIALGVVRTRAGFPQAHRLNVIFDELCHLIEEHLPDAVAMERLFFNSNAKTAMAVGQASGVAMLAASRYRLDVTHYTPSEVKQAVVGVGAAAKSQVQSMVGALLRLSAPTPADAADALALAICHLNRAGLERALKGTA
jgi:crossover junction endodeoxyribonuclease RuvC